MVCIVDRNKPNFNLFIEGSPKNDKTDNSTIFNDQTQLENFEVSVFKSPRSAKTAENCNDLSDPNLELKSIDKSNKDLLTRKYPPIPKENTYKPRSIKSSNSSLTSASTTPR